MENFIDTGDVLSVLKVNPKGKMHKIGVEEKVNAIFADESKRYKIFRKSVANGPVKIDIKFSAD